MGTGPPVPTISDAAAAAAALVSVGARRVLLYGSVAKGDQGPGSDVDLVAVFDEHARFSTDDDSDYVRSHEALSRVLGEIPYDLIMSDWASWEVRSQLGSAIEHEIAAGHVVLADSKAPEGISPEDCSGPSTDAEIAEVLVSAAARTLGMCVLRLQMAAEDNGSGLDSFLVAPAVQDAAAAGRLALAAYLAAVHHTRGRKQRGVGRFTEVWQELPAETAAGLAKGMSVSPEDLDVYGLGSSFEYLPESVEEALTWESAAAVLETSVLLCEFAAESLGPAVDVGPLRLRLSDEVLSRESVAALRSRHIAEAAEAGADCG